MDYQKIVSDNEMEKQIERYREYLVKFGPNLPDNGHKIRLKITSLEEEKQQRDVDRCSKLNHLESSVDYELHDKKKKIANETVTKMDWKRTRKASTFNKSHVISKRSKRNQKSKESSTYAMIVDSNPRDWSCKGSPSHGSSCHKKSDETVINVGDEVEQVAQSFFEDICYPTRDDPCFVQICYKDLECLAPGKFLTSQVMNFYIRFLQEHVSSTKEIHFFNTYFYKKLTDALSYKGNDKLRRWWKGIDLFCKAYIFIPIHEGIHWSLIIVCIPDKEDESGLTILHMDSLGLHSTKPIVENVKRFLIDEWRYLNQDDYSLNLPMSENIWRNLPHMMKEVDIQVPQQKNDFDCGTFVLFFIKRFIEEAPQRLTMKDLRMFDKNWFRPDEASAHRTEIRNTLIALFQEHA